MSGASSLYHHSVRCVLPVEVERLQLLKLGLSAGGMVSACGMGGSCEAES